MGQKLQSHPTGKTIHEYILLRVICYYIIFLNYISESKEIMLF